MTSFMKMNDLFNSIQRTKPCLDRMEGLVAQEVCSEGDLLLIIIIIINIKRLERICFCSCHVSVTYCSLVCWIISIWWRAEAKTNQEQFTFFSPPIASWSWNLRFVKFSLKREKLSSWVQDPEQGWQTRDARKTIHQYMSYIWDVIYLCILKNLLLSLTFLTRQVHVFTTAF